MLTRRGFFAAAAGVAAVTSGAAPAQAMITGVDLAASGSEITSLHVVLPPGAKDAIAESIKADIDAMIRQLLSSGVEPTTLIISEQARERFGDLLATDMPVPLLKIGDVLPANAIPSKALLQACAKEPPAKETPKQFVKRMMLPCPGRLE